MIEIKEYVGKNNIVKLAGKTTKAVTKTSKAVAKKVKQSLTTKEKTNK